MWLELTLTLLAAGTLGAVLLAVGRRALRSLRLPCSPALQAPLSWLIGAWVLSLVVLGLGIGGALRPLPLALGVVALALAGRWRGMGALVRSSGWFLLAALPLAPVALAPPFFYDAWVYHLGLPWQALQEGAWRPHPENLFAAFPPLAQLVYTPALAFDLLRVPGSLHLITAALAAQVAAALARSLGAGRAMARGVGVAALYLPSAPFVPAFPAAESWAWTGILLSIALACRHSAARPLALLVGLTAGIAAAARLQGIPWVAFGVGLLVWSAGARVRSVSLSLLAAAAGAAPWWIKNAGLLGDPLAPLGWRREGIETLWRDAGSTLYLGATPWEVAGGALDALGREAWLLGPLAVLALLGAVSAPRPRPALGVAACAAAGAFVWSLTGSLSRFLIPCLLLLVATSAAARPRLARWIVGLGLLASLAVPGVPRHRDWYRILDYGSLPGEREQVWASRMFNDPTPAFRACRELPGNARIWMVAEPRGLGVPRPFETVSQHDRNLLAAWLAGRPAEQITGELIARGFTHLLVNARELDRLEGRYPVAPWVDPEGRERFLAYLRGLGPPQVREAGIFVFDLDAPRADVAPASRSAVTSRNR